MALASWFHDVVHVLSEIPTNIGRIDIGLLTTSVDGGPTFWAILELKVIKSFTHTASPVKDTDNVEAIIEGVTQAAAYRASTQAELGVLEVYDLRRDKSQNLMAHQRVSNTLAGCSPPPDVHVRPVFGSAKDARDAGYRV